MIIFLMSDIIRKIGYSYFIQSENHTATENMLIIPYQINHLQLIHTNKLYRLLFFNFGLNLSIHILVEMYESVIALDTLRCKM